MIMIFFFNYNRITWIFVVISTWLKTHFFFRHWSISHLGIVVGIPLLYVMASLTLFMPCGDMVWRRLSENRSRKWYIRRWFLWSHILLYQHNDATLCGSMQTGASRATIYFIERDFPTLQAYCNMEECLFSNCPTCVFLLTFFLVCVPSIWYYL
jgi:hypothetical protein